MPLIDVLWDLPGDPQGNVQHIAEHGLVPADIEHVLNHVAIPESILRIAACDRNYAQRRDNCGDL